MTEPSKLDIASKPKPSALIINEAETRFRARVKGRILSEALQGDLLLNELIRGILDHIDAEDAKK